MVTFTTELRAMMKTMDDALTGMMVGVGLFFIMVTIRIWALVQWDPPVRPEGAAEGNWYEFAYQVSVDIREIVLSSLVVGAAISLLVFLVASFVFMMTSRSLKKRTVARCSN